LQKYLDFTIKYFWLSKNKIVFPHAKNATFFGYAYTENATFWVYAYIENAISKLAKNRGKKSHVRVPLSNNVNILLFVQLVLSSTPWPCFNYVLQLLLPPPCFSFLLAPAPTFCFLLKLFAPQLLAPAPCFSFLLWLCALVLCSNSLL